VNYPFDDGHGTRAKTGDNELFMTLSYSYAKAHKRMFKKGHRCLDSRLNDPMDPTLGIVNGASWYEVSSSMQVGSFRISPISNLLQDWMFVYGNCFEVTVEMNCVKFPKASELYDLWNEHKFALLHFIDQIHHSIHGFITDEQTGFGIWNASILIGPKEKVVHSYKYGDYWRLILPGTYEVEFRHENYYPKHYVVKISEYTRSLSFNVTLRPHSYLISSESANSSVLTKINCFLMVFLFLLIRYGYLH
jgi:carboxypeptidase D